MRRWRVAVISLTLSACATWAASGSLYRDRCTHVGVRPTDPSDSYALTVQVTTDWPICPR